MQRAFDDFCKGFEEGFSAAEVRDYSSLLAR